MFYIDGNLCLQCIFVYPIKVSYLILFLSSLVNAGLLCFCCFLCGSPLLLFLRVVPHRRWAYMAYIYRASFYVEDHLSLLDSLSTLLLSFLTSLYFSFL